ncbi:uncharacterized [Tachysurus ichikawai]
MNVGDTYANDTLLSTHLFGEVKRELKLHSASFFLTNVGEKKTSDAVSLFSENRCLTNRGGVCARATLNSA